MKGLSEIVRQNDPSMVEGHGKASLVEGHGKADAQVTKLKVAEAEEKAGRRLRREGKVAEAIEAYSSARDLYAETGLQYLHDDDNDVMRAIRRCDAIVGNLRHPKEQRPPATTPRPNCLDCGKPLRRYKIDDRTFTDGTPREWGDYGDHRFCGLRCGWHWACAHSALPTTKKDRST